MSEHKYTIAIDFDGTIVKHAYPDIGDVVPYAFHCMREFIDKGFRLILLTMRSGKDLQRAIEFCEARGIHFWAVNFNPEQRKWTQSPKIYADLYIDDANAGTPLMQQYDDSRPYVDWFRLMPRIKDRIENVPPIKILDKGGDE